MKTSCPNCGAPVEFRYDDSFVRICEHCRNAVLRTDRGVDSLGKVADLVPMESPLKLFAEGRYGSEGFMLVGMAQLRHPAGGIWQEWYAKLDGGRWGWLAEAQGRYYLMFEEAGAVPDGAEVRPGQDIELPGHKRWFTVAEVNTGEYVAAAGELPYRLVPQGTFRYADLSDGDGLFATIDFGGDGDEPTAYVGRQVTLAELGMRGGEEGPSREATISSKRLACPHCNAPIELRAPGESLRVVCGSCNSLLDLQSEAATVVRTQEAVGTPAIPLGSKGTFAEGAMTVIGYVKRSAQIDLSWYPFEEYLLHAPELGFRWLVCSDGNWSYVQPIAVGAVDERTSQALYDGVRFEAYQSGTLRVDGVLGELYWRVEVGEQVQSQDYIAPPAMISRERDEHEINWSLSSYLTPAEVSAAFGDQVSVLPPVTDVGANAPEPTHGIHRYFAWGLAALCGVAAVMGMMAPHRKALDTSVIIPAGTPPPADGSGATPDSDHVAFTNEFPLVAGENVAIHLDAYVDNDWAYVACDLVAVDTGEVVSFDANLEYYHGYSDGESWSEGHHSKTQFLGPRKAGTYMLRIESQHGNPGNTTLQIMVEQGVFRWTIFAVALLVLGLITAGAGGIALSFETRRWNNANDGSPQKPGLGTVIAGGLAAAAGIALLIYGGIG